MYVLSGKRKIANYRQCCSTYEKKNETGLWLKEHINDILSRSA